MEPAQLAGMSMTEPTRTRPLRILLATDDSPSARNAEAWAVALRPDGERVIDVVTVAHEAAWSWQTQTYRPQVRDAVEGLREAELNEAQRVANLVGERLQADARVTTRTWGRAGEAAEAILAMTEDTDPDVVAVGHRGRSALAELVLGSVARSVVRDAPCTVLVAWEAPVGPSAPTRAVLLADHTPATAHVVAAVARLGILRGAEVLLLATLSAPDAAPALAAETAVDALERHGATIEALAAQLREAGVVASTRVEIGDPVAAAAAALDPTASDLLIVPRGTPCRPGSVADRVIHEVRHSVLAVPAV